MKPMKCVAAGTIFQFAGQTLRAVHVAIWQHRCVKLRKTSRPHGGESVDRRRVGDAVMDRHAVPMETPSSVEQVTGTDAEHTQVGTALRELQQSDDGDGEAVFQRQRRQLRTVPREMRQTCVSDAKAPAKVQVPQTRTVLRDEFHADVRDIPAAFHVERV